jgi:tRNA G18 (ribose-2'-O)-methylase SpoU
MIVHVTDSSDPRLDAFRWRDRQLANRLDRAEKVGAGLFVAEGDLVVERAIQASCTPSALLLTDDMVERFATLVPTDVPLYVGDDELRRDVTGLGVPLSVTGLFRRPPRLSVDEVTTSSTHVVVLEAVDNPTNVGAIIRSAAALGWHALILDPTSSDPLARRSLRVSMGTALSLPFARSESEFNLVDQLHEGGYTCIGMSPDPSAHDIDHWKPSSKRIALFMGSERVGLTDETMTSLDAIVRIRMHEGIDSLNVGAAAAIALHAYAPR